MCGQHRAVCVLYRMYVPMFCMCGCGPVLASGRPAVTYLRLRVPRGTLTASWDDPNITIHHTGLTQHPSVPNAKSLPPKKQDHFSFLVLTYVNSFMERFHIQQLLGFFWGGCSYMNFVSAVMSFTAPITEHQPSYLSSLMPEHLGGIFAMSSTQRPQHHSTSSS